MREVFVPREAEDESGLTPGEDDNEAWRGKHRKTIDNWMGDWYKAQVQQLCPGKAETDMPIIADRKTGSSDLEPAGL